MSVFLEMFELQELAMRGLFRDLTDGCPLLGFHSWDSKVKVSLAN